MSESYVGLNRNKGNKVGPVARHCKDKRSYAEVLKSQIPSRKSITTSGNRARNTLTTSGYVNKDLINLAVWNAQSLKQKTQLTRDFLSDNDIDILLVTESWLSCNDTVEIGELEENNGYRYMHIPREGRSGGGVACISKSSMKIRKIHSPKTKTFEHMEVLLSGKSNDITLIIVYRPEPSRANPYSLNEFYSEFTNFIAMHHISNKEFVVAGDFNFHVNKNDNLKAKHFLEILDTFNLSQHVTGSTHKNGNTLDLVITPANWDKMGSCSIGELLSDHNCILFDLKISPDVTKSKKIKYRVTKSIDISKFRKDIAGKLSFSPKRFSCLNYVDKLVNVYNSTQEVLDKHAPLKTGNVLQRKPTPWTSAEIKKLKSAKRKAEKKWKRTKSEIDFSIYKCKRNTYNNYLNCRKVQALSEDISKNRSNSKALFKLINARLNRKQETPLPDHDDSKMLADEFITFFDEKISLIQSKLDIAGNHRTSRRQQSTYEFVGTKLNKFRLLTQDEVRKLLSAMSTKHCQLDPIPTWLMKECIDQFLPITTEIINASLKIGKMPRKLKHAIIKPLLKKYGLELIKKHYRPVSNLAFLGKLIESAVISQYLEHLNANKLHDNQQSAYKKYHSTETLLTKIHNDVLCSLSKGDVVMLVMLDLSAAFDTVNHKILLDRLTNLYGVEGTALSWFKSYLTNRTQSVLINNEMSRRTPLNCGVPQGSKLGPILFNSYIAPLSKIARNHNIHDEKYADDEQLILAFQTKPLQNQMIAKKNIEKCIRGIQDFLIQNRLCNNGEKTELLLIGNKCQLRELAFDSIEVGGCHIKTVDNVKNLGVFFDKHMRMDKQITNMCRNAYFNLKNISKIRNSLSLEDTKTLVNALVTPHLDYGNGLLYGIPKRLENKLQVAHNSAARLIFKLKRRDRISSYKKKLHWLPFPARIHYKLLTMTWKTLNNQSPQYLKDLITVKEPMRDLRSNVSTVLEVPGFNSRNSLADRSFASVAPKLWNKLPLKVKLAKSLNSFKKNLKTHLFQHSYINDV